MSTDVLIIESRHCKNCGESFGIRTCDQQFYARLEVPFPTWCPACRHIRRHGHVNDYVHYARNCDSCGGRIVASFPAQSPYKVICQRCWYSEDRDDRAEGIAYDPARSFFSQFDELMHRAPQMGNLAINVENCDYCESIADCKNCYLISECSNCEDCFYSYWIQKSRDCVDTCYLHECEKCYEVSDSFNCYALQYSSNCQNCADSYFLDNCIGCRNCAFCTNLHRQEYYIFNQPYSKDGYFSELARLKLSDRNENKVHRETFQLFLQSQPRKCLQVEQCENSLGDYLRNAKNCFTVFHGYDAEECAYGEHVWRGAQNCLDVNTAGRGAEWLYETTNTNMGAYFTKFARYCWGCRFVEYSNMCVNSSYLFGCVGLKAGAKYCILNQQYSESEYFPLVEQIKRHMRMRGEYGEFFPLSISLFGYNNTVSFDDRPYSQSEVLAKGWKWEEAASGITGRGDLDMLTIPDLISDTAESICQNVLTCVQCQRNYRITNQEFRFYQSEAIPVPLRCHDCRHRLRLARRNRRQMRLIACADCGVEVTTTLDSIVYRRIVCPSCYSSACNETAVV